jgi:hypothetical protein
MAADQPETDGFVAFIERKIAALQALLDSYRAAQALGALGQGDDSPAPFTFNNATAGNVAGLSYDLPNGVFLNKTMPAAIKLFLMATKRKQTPKDVAAALKDGGFESTSVNFEKIVTTTMHRMKGEGELLQFKDGWGLAELYPESLRLRIGVKESKDVRPAKGGKKTRKSPQRKGKVKAKTKDSTETGPKAVPAA